MSPERRDTAATKHRRSVLTKAMRLIDANAAPVTILAYLTGGLAVADGIAHAPDDDRPYPGDLVAEIVAERRQP